MRTCSKTPHAFTADCITAECAENRWGRAWETPTPKNAGFVSKGMVPSESLCAAEVARHRSAFQLQCPPVTYFLLLTGMRSFLSFSTLRNWRSCLKSSEGNAIKRNKVLLWRLVKKVYGSWIKEERSGGYNPSKVNFGRGERIFWYCCRFLGNFLVCTCACMVWWQT